MLTEFKLPELGENIKTGTAVKIAVKVGDFVKKDQPLLELETDKATVEVPSPVEGTIKEILIKEGDQIAVGQTIMRIESGVKKEEPKIQEPLPKEIPKAKKEKEFASQVQLTKPDKTPETSISQPTPEPLAVTAAPPSKDVPAAPSVRRFAREIGIDVSQVPGSGSNGRISVEDVKAYAKQLNTKAMGRPSSAFVPQQPLPDFSKWGETERKPMNNVRRKTAEHLSFAWTTIPHVTQFDKADITELEKLRKRYSTAEQKLTITPFLVKVLASALKAFPQFNASVDITRSEVVYKKYFHIGVAVDTDRGLLVPVVRDVDKKSIWQLAKELNDTAQRARDKKTALDELQGGCFSLTNLGSIGGTNFTPIVNWPEVAILGVARAKWEQVYLDNHFVPRLMLPLSLSYDHRVVDGADGARFLRWVVEAIQQPFLMELEK